MKTTKSNYGQMLSDKERRSFLSGLFFWILALLTTFSFKKESGIGLQKDIETQLADITKLQILNVKKFGAKGDGVTDDSQPFQDAFNAMTSSSSLFVPSGNYVLNNGVNIPASVSKLLMYGEGFENTNILVSANPAFNVYSEGFKVRGIHFKSDKYTDGSGADYIYFQDTRTTNTADFDIDIRDCNFEVGHYIVSLKGRGVTLKNNIIYKISNAWVKVDFPPSASFVDGGSDQFKKLETGMRGYVFQNNRNHYSPGYVLENKGYNAANITGIHIVDNHFESGALINGYVRDATIAGNIMYQNTLSKVPLINATAIRNTTISGNMFKGEDITNATPSGTQFGQLINSLYTENLTVTGNTINGVKNDVYLFDGGSTNIVLKGNVTKNICTTQGSYVTFRGPTVHDGVVVEDIIQTPNRSNWVALQISVGTRVKNYTVNSKIYGGSYQQLHAFDPTNHDFGINNNRVAKVTGTYTGNGTSKTITLHFKPAIFHIYASDESKNIIKTCDSTKFPEIKLTSTGVTLDTTLSVSGVEYYWEAT